jgi:hypothetical protein
MRDTGEQSALFERLVCMSFRIHRPSQELERHFTVEPWIPGPVDVAKGATCQTFEQFEMAPPRGRRSAGLPRSLRS